MFIFVDDIQHAIMLALTQGDWRLRKTLVPLIRYWLSSGITFQELVFKKCSGSWKEKCLGSLLSTGLCNEEKDISGDVQCRW